MVSQERLLQQFREAVEEIRGEVDDFDSTSPLSDVGVDSLDLIEVGMMLEDEYDIRLDEKAFEGATVVADVLDAVTRQINDTAAS